VAERGWGQLLAWRRRRGAAEDALPHPKELFALADDARARGCTWSAIETYGQGIDLALRLLWSSSRPVWLRECVATFRELAEAERMKRAPVPLVPLEEVYRCGLELMRGGLARTPSIRTTLMIRDGFAIMLLCWRPKRSGNLHRARIGIELRLDEHGKPMDLVFATTKNRDPSETPFPAQLIEAYHLYCDRARRLLDLHGGDALWVGETGGPMTQAGFADAIRRRLEAAFGRSLGPHAFRTFYASSLGGLDPSLMPFVSTMLDHRHPDTADRYYKRSNDAHAAGRALEAVLGELLPEALAAGDRERLTGSAGRRPKPIHACLLGLPRQAGRKG
jgi:integrase